MRSKRVYRQTVFFPVRSQDARLSVSLQLVTPTAVQGSLLTFSLASHLSPFLLLLFFFFSFFEKGLYIYPKRQFSTFLSSFLFSLLRLYIYIYILFFFLRKGCISDTSTFYISLTCSLFVSSSIQIYIYWKRVVYPKNINFLHFPDHCFFFVSTFFPPTPKRLNNKRFLISTKQSANCRHMLPLTKRQTDTQIYKTRKGGEKKQLSCMSLLKIAVEKLPPSQRWS